METTKHSIVFRYVKYETQKCKEGIQVYQFDTITLQETKIKGEFYSEDDENNEPNSVRCEIDRFNQNQAYRFKKERKTKSKWSGVYDENHCLVN